MKAISLARLTIVILTVISFSMLAVTPACTSAGGIDKEKTVSAANIALEYAVSADKLSTEDAELIREALVVVSAGKLDRDSIVPAAILAVSAAEKRGAISPERAAQIKLALSLLR